MARKKTSAPRKLVCVISDASGATAERVVRATLEQFEDTSVDVEIIPHVTTVEQIKDIVKKLRRRSGLIAYTLVETELRSEVAALANEAGVDTVDLIGPVIHALAGYLSATPSEKPGFRYDRADPEHFTRLEAVSFTVRHDDGMNLSDLQDADFVVVGPSRTSKTPLCAYLAHTRGLKVANVPFALGVDPPPELKKLPAGRVVALTMNAGTLSAIRRERMKTLGAPTITYAQREHVQRELKYCHSIYRAPPAWPIIDVTSKSVEEVATAVCALTIDAPPRKE